MHEPKFRNTNSDSYDIKTPTLMSYESCIEGGSGLQFVEAMATDEEPMLSWPVQNESGQEESGARSRGKSTIVVGFS